MESLGCLLVRREHGFLVLATAMVLGRVLKRRVLLCHIVIEDLYSTGNVIKEREREEGEKDKSDKYRE